ncbi:hypothetical protein ACVH9Z_39100 [Rhodococcus opacus]
MALDDQLGRWVQRTSHVRDTIGQFLQVIPADEDVLTGQMLGTLQGMLEDPIHAADSDVPPDPSPLAGALSPFVTALRAFDAVTDAPATTADLLSLLSGLHDSARETHTKLTTDDRLSTQTVDEVIADFAQEYRISLLLTLTANHALTQTAVRWQKSKAADTATGDHLDITAMDFVTTADTGTIPMSALVGLITASPTIMTPFNMGSAMKELMTGGAPPSLYRMAYAQWFTNIYATWEDVYRKRLAVAHGADDDGEAWTKNDIRSEFFNEVRLIRHDISHKVGTCVESAGNTLIDWTKPGEPIAPTPRQMISLLDAFPYAELQRTPTRTVRTNGPLPFQFPLDWIEQVNDYITSLEATKKKRPAVLKKLIDDWMRDTTEPPESADADTSMNNAN